MGTTVTDDKILTHRSQIPQPLAIVPDPEDAEETARRRHPSAKSAEFTFTFTDPDADTIAALFLNGLTAHLPDPATCWCGHLPSAHEGDDEHCAVDDCPCGRYRAIGEPCGLCWHRERDHRALCLADDGSGGACSCLVYVPASTRCETCNHHLYEHGQGHACRVGDDLAGCGCDRFTVLIDTPEAELAKGGIFRAIRGSEPRRSPSLPDPTAIARYAAELMGAFAGQGIRHDIAVQLTAAVLAGRRHPE